MGDGVWKSQSLYFTSGRGEIEELLERSERGVLEVSAFKTHGPFFSDLVIIVDFHQL